MAIGFFGADQALLGPRFFYAPTPGDDGGNSEIAPGAEVSLTLDNFCSAVDPDPAWLPGTKRLEVVDKEGHLAVACHNIFVFARGL